MIKSSITKDEYFNMVKKHKSTNASTPEFRKQELDAITAFPVGTKFAFKEDNSWHDVNTVYEKIDDNVWKITQVINGKVNDEYTKSDDEMRIYISDEFGGNAYPTSYVSGYGSINSSRRNNMIKSSWKQFIKGLDKLEKRNELKEMYNSAHWEFLDYIMPCDPEWTADMADGDFNPLDEIYFLFKSPSDIEEFLFECAKENLPSAKEKLQRIRQINTCNKVYSSRQIKSAYTREDYDRFDEVGNFIPYKPTEEELAKKDEIKKVLDKELAAAFEPDPMDDYAGYDSTSERMDSAVEKVANQFGVDTDFAWECAGELMNEENARQYEEAEWAQNNLEGDEYDKWYRGELDIRDRIHSSRQIKSSRYDESLLHKENSINTQYIKSQLLSIASKYFSNLRQDRYFKNHIHLDEHYMLDYNCEKRSDYSQGFGEYFIQIYNFDDRTSKVSWAGYGKENFNKDLPDIEQMIKSISSSSKPIKSSIITPWNTNQVTGTSDEDLGLSAVVDMYGNEFVNVDASTLNELKDTLVRYFDDEAYVRDWNINNPDYQIEDAFEVTDPEEMDVEDLARYFDYEAYGRDIRLEDNIVWDSENQYWVSAHDVDDEELNDDKYVFMRG